MNAIRIMKEFTDRLKTERERKRDNVEKEDFLLNQIDEFREKARQLQDLFSSQETKVQELQEIVEEREGKAKELSDMIEERQDAAAFVVAGVTTQIEGLIEKVDAKLSEMNDTFAERLADNEENTAEQNEEVRNLLKEQNETLTQTVNGLNGQFDKLENSVCEKVHTESVQCYRNMQVLLEESDKKIEEIRDDLSRISSLRTLIMFTLIFTILNLIGISGVIASILGLI